MGMEKFTNGTLATMAYHHAMEKLSCIEQYLRELRDAQTERKHYVLQIAQQVGAGETVVRANEAIPPGYTFVAKRIAAMAPASTKLSLYLDAKIATNFIEVITNIQEYANGSEGDLYIPERSVLVAVFSGAAAEGPAMVRLEGELIPNRD